MAAGGVSAERLARTPRLVEGCDPTSLEISPVEGFLLSRIDGRTPWQLLREIGGMPADAVDACIERWLSVGVIEIEGVQTTRPVAHKARASAPAEEPTAASTGTRSAAREPDIDTCLLDESLDLDLDTQRRILAFEAGLDRSYYVLLGVARDADRKAIKRAYFTLSKEFHPDRYFRREIGGYADRLGRIFKKVLEAYELLSDPTTRAEVDKSMFAEVSTAATPAAGEPARPLTPIERLRQRMPFKIPEGLIAERREKALEFFKAAEQWERRGNFLEAASSIRLAIAFDPYNARYKERFGEVQVQAVEMRAAELLERAESGKVEYREGHEHEREALRLYEEVLLYKPHDPVANDKAARLALELEQLAKAREYAERAVEHSPDVADYRTTLARIFYADRDKGHAIFELQKALQVDSGHSEAAKLLSEWKRGQRSELGGTR